MRAGLSILLLALLAGTAAGDTPTRIFGVSMVSPTHGYVMGAGMDYGSAFETKDGGKTFARMPHGKDEQPVFIPGGQIVLIHGGKGTCGDEIEGVTAVDARHAWGTSCDDTAMKNQVDMELDATSDGGRHWHAVASARSDGNGALPYAGDKSSPVFADARHGWIVVTKPCVHPGCVWRGWAWEVLATRDGGHTFRRLVLPGLGQKWNLHAQRVQMGALSPRAVFLWVDRYRADARVWISDDAGATWHALPPIPGTRLPEHLGYPWRTSVSVVSPKLAFARGLDGVLRVWNDPRRAWRKVRFIRAARGGYISFVDGRHGWLYRPTFPIKEPRPRDYLWRTEDGGKTWTQLR